MIMILEFEATTEGSLNGNWYQEGSHRIQPGG